MTNLAFQIQEEDVERVLFIHSLKIANSDGKPLKNIADDVFNKLNHDLIEKAALHGLDLDIQTQYAQEEIGRQLVEMGVLESLQASEYQIPVTFTFSGLVKVEAITETAAKEIAESGFGLTLNGGIHESDDRIKDWNFDAHPEKMVGVKQDKTTINLNVFDDDGVVVDSTTADLTLQQISDIVDHASQLILLRREGKPIRSILDELDEALSSSGVLDPE